MSRIVAFLGSDHKCGTSQLALCCAIKLAKLNPKEKVLLIHAQEDLGDDYSPNIRESMDRINPYLKGKLIDAEEILNKSEYENNLYVVGGAGKPFSSDNYNPELVEYFLFKMLERCTYIICDCGAQLDYSITIGALCAADEVFMVLTQKESSLKRYEWTTPIYSRLGVKRLNFVVNMYSAKSPYDLGYISDRLGIEKEFLFSVRMCREGELAEIFSKPLFFYKNRGFDRDVTRLSAKIIENESV